VSSEAGVVEVLTIGASCIKVFIHVFFFK
jgi:hypothetical protein